MIRAMASFGGIDLGGTKIQAVVVDSGHEVLGSARHPTPSSGGPKAVPVVMDLAMREVAVADYHFLLPPVGLGSVTTAPYHDGLDIKPPLPPPLEENIPHS